MIQDGHFFLYKKKWLSFGLRIDHTYPEQEAYVLLLSRMFASLMAREPKIGIIKADPRTGKIYKSIYFKTLRFV